MAPSDQDLLNLTMDTDCYRELDSTEKGKVQKALNAEKASTPRSNIGKVAFYLARRLHPVAVDPPPPPPPPPPVKKYAPLAYNSGTGPNNTGLGKEPSARYNIRINCTRIHDDLYVDGEGLSYDGGGRQKGGRTENYVPGLKFANSMDGKEVYETYTDSPDGQPHPPYPAASYER